MCLICQIDASEPGLVVTCPVCRVEYCLQCVHRLLIFAGPKQEPVACPHCRAAWPVSPEGVTLHDFLVMEARCTLFRNIALQREYDHIITESDLSMFQSNIDEVIVIEEPVRDVTPPFQRRRRRAPQPPRKRGAFFRELNIQGDE